MVTKIDFKYLHVVDLTYCGKNTCAPSCGEVCLLEPELPLLKFYQLDKIVLCITEVESFPWVNSVWGGARTYHHAIFCDVFWECISYREDPPALPTYQNGSFRSSVVCYKMVQKFNCFKSLCWAQPAKRGEHLIHVPEILLWEGVLLLYRLLKCKALSASYSSWKRFCM